MIMAPINKDLLIELVKNEPRLWDQRNKAYHNRDLKPKLWLELAEILGVDANLAKKTWDCLRDVYRRKLKAFKETQSGQEAVAHPKWLYFTDLDFLRDVTTPRKNSGNLESPSSESLSSEIKVELNSDIYDDTDIDIDETSLTKIEFVENDVGSNQSEETQTLEMPESKRPKRKLPDFYSDQLELEKKKFDLLQDRFRKKDDRPEDADKQFLMSLLPDLKRFNPEQKLRVKMEIMSSIVRELEKNSNNPNF